MECTSIPRQMEHLHRTDSNIAVSNEIVATLRNDTEKGTFESTSNMYTWSTGIFQPDERYVKYVTVVTCRRRPSDKSVVDNELDWDQVYEHVHRVNNQWYQQTNPMLTKQRVQTIERAFASSTNETGSKETELNLQQCYPVLFTDGERENLSYEDFIDDWRSFLTKYSNRNDPECEQIPTDKMSFSTAIAFLHVMQ